MNREANLCRSVYHGPGSGEKCPYDVCKFIHDIDRYFAEKPDDIGPVCPIYTTKGFCPRGLTCRFAQNHIDDNRNNCKQDWYDEATANDSVNQLTQGLFQCFNRFFSQCLHFTK